MANSPAAGAPCPVLALALRCLPRLLSARGRFILGFFLSSLRLLGPPLASYDKTFPNQTRQTQPPRPRSLPPCPLLLTLVYQRRRNSAATSPLCNNQLCYLHNTHYPSSPPRPAFQSAAAQASASLAQSTTDLKWPARTRGAPSPAGASPRPAAPRPPCPPPAPTGPLPHS